MTPACGHRSQVKSEAYGLNAGRDYLQRITNAFKSRQSRDLKGPDGSNLPPSATQSGMLPYIMEKR